MCQATTFCTVARNIFGSSVWELLSVTIVAPIILRCPEVLFKIWATLCLYSIEGHQGQLDSQKHTMCATNVHKLKMPTNSKKKMYFKKRLHCVLEQCYNSLSRY
jgi:hypothetical protein